MWIRTGFGSGSGTQLKNNLMMQVNQPSRSLRAHGDKVSIVKFSPTAVDVVATAAFDWTVKIWNLDTAEVSLSRSPL
jgi:WD40 repeat protein